MEEEGPHALEVGKEEKAQAQEEDEEESWGALGKALR
jgi:hypothetical protein